METAINNSQITEPVEKNKRGRPAGSVDPAVTEAKKAYSLAQVSKLKARLVRLHEEIQKVEEKISRHSNDS